MTRFGRSSRVAVHVRLGVAVFFEVGVLDLSGFRPCVDGVYVEKDVYNLDRLVCIYI